MDWLSGIGEIIASIFPLLDHVPPIRALLGFILVFLLPGFAWTLVFFSGRQINIVERLALSLGLSIAVVTLSIIALHKLIGMSIIVSHAILVIIAITVIPLAIYGLKRLTLKRENSDV